MNIEIQKTKKNSALMRAMVSDDIMEAYKARVAFAAYITEPVQQIIDAAPILQRLFFNRSYTYGEPATVPLVPLFDIKTAGFFRVTSQSRAGGLATSQYIDSPEFPVSTYTLEGAVSMRNDYLRAARVDVLADYINHLAQNFLVKSEVNRMAVIAHVIANTTYKLKGVDTKQVYRTLNQAAILPQDLNAVNRILARINAANIGGGTPAGASKSLTDLVGSPEFVETVRNMAWEPLNNTLRSTYPLGGPNKFRDEVYDASGDPTILGARITTINQFGTNEEYNILFGAACGALTYPGYAAGSAAVFAPGSEQLVLAVNTNVKALVTLSETTDPESSATLKVMPDNQFSNRAEEVGFYAKKKEGHVSLDGRNIVGLVF